MNDTESSSHVGLTQDELINESRAFAASIERVKPALVAWGQDNHSEEGFIEREMALRANWAPFHDNHLKIVRDPTNIINREFERVETLYLATVSYIVAWKRRLGPPVLTPAPGQAENRQTPAYRLPKINLPTFSGNVLERSRPFPLMPPP